MFQCLNVRDIYLVSYCADCILGLIISGSICINFWAVLAVPLCFLFFTFPFFLSFCNVLKQETILLIYWEFRFLCAYRDLFFQKEWLRVWQILCIRNIWIIAIVCWSPQNIFIALKYRMFHSSYSGYLNSIDLYLRLSLVIVVLPCSIAKLVCSCIYIVSIWELRIVTHNFQPTMIVWQGSWALYTTILNTLLYFIL